VFALVGAFAVIPAWRAAGWRVVLFALVALIVVRVVAVAIALLGSGMSRRNILFMGWFGPRGIGTLVLGVLVVDRGDIHQASLIGQVVVVTVTVSLVVHSLTTPLGIRLCAEGGTPRPAGNAGPQPPEAVSPDGGGGARLHR
jgi:sodium/hydrogen antiporter